MSALVKPLVLVACTRAHQYLAFARGPRHRYRRRRLQRRIAVGDVVSCGAAKVEPSVLDRSRTNDIAQTISLQRPFLQLVPSGQETVGKRGQTGQSIVPTKDVAKIKQPVVVVNSRSTTPARMLLRTAIYRNQFYFFVFSPTLSPCIIFSKI